MKKKEKRKKCLVTKNYNSITKCTLYKVRNCDICFEIIASALADLFEPPKTDPQQSIYPAEPLPYFQLVNILNIVYETH